MVDVAPTENADYLLRVFERHMNEVGLPSMAYGNLPRGDTEMSSVTMSQIADAATAYLSIDTRSLVEALRRCITLMMSLCAEKIDPEKVATVLARKTEVVAPEKPSLIEVQLKASDFKRMRIDVALNTESGADKARKYQIGLQLLGLPEADRPFDKRTIQEKFFDIRDPEKILFRKLGDIIDASPRVLEMLQRRAELAYGGPLTEYFGEERQRPNEQVRQTVPGPMPGTAPNAPIGNAPSGAPGLPYQPQQLPPEVVQQLVQMQRGMGGPPAGGPPMFPGAPR